MAYRVNPFLDRMSERTTSDQEFVRIFSPKILDRLSEDCFEGAVHIFRSPPGAGKTTLLRALTPAALRAFWNARQIPATEESYQRFLARGVFHPTNGPELIGVFLTCASGYADLPPGATPTNEGVFRALLNSRIVLRTLRNLATLLSISDQQLVDVQLEYDRTIADLKSIPLSGCGSDLLAWAEGREREVYAKLDHSTGEADALPADVRLEGVLWLQAVQFTFKGNRVAPRRLLMIDDLHKLRRKQRSFLISELVDLRSAMPIWLAERNIALGDELLSQGARDGRDLRQYSLEQFWTAPGGQHQFVSYAQNILDRRLADQNEIPAGAFVQYLRTQLLPEEIQNYTRKHVDSLRSYVGKYAKTVLYREWANRADGLIDEHTFESLRDFYTTKILITRDETKRQMTLELAPLNAVELEERDSSQVQGAAEIFMHDELGVPYYFGLDRLCTMATYNVEELLSLAAPLYEALVAKQILRKPGLLLAPDEQEKLLKDAAKGKRDFIPKSHTEGTRAQCLLDSIGVYCRDRTFLPTAPYAPGVTGVRLSQAELSRLENGGRAILEFVKVLKRVLAECIAENLLLARPSSASTGRDSGTIFYLNRTLCAHYGLPLQMGGWQDVSVETLIAWCEQTPRPGRSPRLELA